MTLKGQPRNSEGSVEHWWFNLVTGEVEFGLQSSSSNRIGPFASEGEARRALEIIADRATAWKESETEDL